MLNLDYKVLAIVITTTILFFSWIRKVENITQRVWYSLLVFFLLIYSGIGTSIEGANLNYLYFYYIYIFTLSVTIYYQYKKYKNQLFKTTIDDKKILLFIDNYGQFIINLYIILNIFDLLYPNFKLHLLVSPPLPSLDNHFNKYIDDVNLDPISHSFYIFKQFLLPFFYLSLYKYRNNYKKVLFILLIILYINYCVSGYVGRGEILVAFIIVFLPMLSNASSKRRRFLLFGGIFFIPLIAYLLVQFSYIRLGSTTENMTIMEALGLLFKQEISYPLLYDDYISASTNYGIAEYLLWIVFLPLPGFLKFGLNNFDYIIEFSSNISGLYAYESGFSIILPGIVGESIYIFGKVLFPCHAILLGIIISFLMRYLSSSKIYQYLTFFFVIKFTYALCRAGTVSVYPMFFKYFLIFILITYLLSKKK